MGWAKFSEWRIRGDFLYRGDLIFEGETSNPSANYEYNINVVTNLLLFYLYYFSSKWKYCFFLLILLKAYQVISFYKQKRNHVKILKIYPFIYFLQRSISFCLPYSNLIIQNYRRIKRIKHYKFSPYMHDAIIGAFAQRNLF